MPNKQSRTRAKRNTRGNRGGTNAVTAPVWAIGTNTPELKTFVTQGANFQLYHNVPVAMANTANLLDQIGYGTTATQRIGSRISIKSLRVRLILNNKADRPNVSYRVACTASPASTNTDAFSELFPGSGITGIHSKPNSQLYHDTVFPLNQGSLMEGASNRERSFNHTFEIPVNHAAVYSTADNVCTTRLTVWICAYDSFGSLATDNIASVAQLTYAIDFTDC
jgi:hypothetical protein